jgi:hypothetical protein
VANGCANTDCQNGSVTVLLGNGDGTFVTGGLYSSGGQLPSAIAVADVNQDGHPDLIVVNSASANSISVLLGNGDGTFQTPLSYYSGGNAPYSLAFGDINGDGKLDLAVTNACGDTGQCSDGSTAGVLLGNGDGTFQQAVTYSSGGFGAYRLALGDVNNDGKLDLLVANECGGSSACNSNGTVGVLLGNGDGTFQPPMTYDAGGQDTYSVVAADINGDGKSDLVVTNYCLIGGNGTCVGDGTVGVLLGKGDGTFQSSVTYDSGGWNAWPVQVADVNADGKLDVVVANECGSSSTCATDGTMSVLLGNGDGTLQPAILYDSGGQQTVSLAVGDLNADGMPDVAVANACSDKTCVSGSVGVLLNVSPAATTTVLASAPNPSALGEEVTFTATVSRRQLRNNVVPTGSVSFFDGTTSIGTSSLNTDGTAILPLSTLLPGRHSITATYNGDANDAPSTSPLLSQTVRSTTNNPVPVINPPLVPDSVAPGVGGFTLTVNGTGFVSGSVVDWNGSARPTTFVSQFQLQTTISASDVALATTALVSVESPTPGGGRSNVVYLSVTLPSLSVPFSRTDYPTGQGVGPQHIVATDLNADGKLDLALADDSYPNRSLTVFMGNGDGTFANPQSYSLDPSGAPNAVAVGDFNGDGIPDAAVAVGIVNTVAILLGNGDGSFQSPVSYSVASGPVMITTADFNGDGHLDLAVVAEDNRSVSILLGNGDGTFQGQVVYSTGGQPFGIAAGDFNRDGVLDLVVGNFSTPSTIGVLIGNGDGTFQPVVTYSIKQGPNRLALADLNSDGKLDLVASGNGIAVLLGNGDGTFQAEADYGSGVSTWDAVVSDVNGDGIPDVATADAIGEMTLFLGNGNGTFQPPVSYPAGGDPISIAAGDFNGDGRIDLVSANLTGGSVTVLLQTPTIRFTPSSLQFPNEHVNKTSSPLIVTVTVGPLPVTLTSILASGDFAETNNCPINGVLQSGATCTISVTFTPTVTGLRTGNVIVTDNAAGSPQSIPLSGTGVVPAVTLSPSSLQFPTLVIHTTSKAQQVTLTNSGTGTLIISNIATSGDFAQTNSCGRTLAVGASCSISVTFTPTVKGQRSGALTITDNAIPTTQTVSLSGTGTIVNLSSPKLTFAPQKVGTRSNPLSVTVTNVGKTSLTITGIAIGGTNRSDFSQTNTCPAVLAAGKNCTISVTFKPTAIGSRTANVAITDNGGGSPQLVALSGTGT